MARYGLQGDGIWRCYSPSALDSTKRRYIGGKAFCSQPGLLAVHAICNGSTPGPYPLPPAAGTGGGSGGCASPFLAGDANSTLPVLDSARDKTEYRIPVVVSIPGTEVVVALAENRGLGSTADSGRHKLALARSTDGGASFSPVVNIYNDSAGTLVQLGSHTHTHTNELVLVLMFLTSFYTRRLNVLWELI